MRLVLVCPFDPKPLAAESGGAHVGGVERVFAETGERLAKRGHEVTLLCSTDGPPQDSTQGGVHFVRRTRHGTALRAPLARLANALTRDADVVQVAGTYPFTTPKVLRRARQLELPSILDFHFEPAPGTRLGRMAASMYRRVGPPSYLLADRVLVRSFEYARSARSLGPVPQDRWRVVPNGIDPARFRPNGARGGGDYLLFVGRLVPYKGVDVLLHALARMREPPPLKIVGDGPLRRRLESLAKRYALPVQFLGPVSDDDLPDLYRHAILTVLPSVTSQEAFGIALLESMACGTPVIASALPGVADIAKRGGVAVRPADPASLSQAILRALETRELPRGHKLAKSIHEEFGWDRVVDRLEAVYTEVLSSRGRPTTTPSEVTTHTDPRGHAVL